MTFDADPRACDGARAVYFHGAPGSPLELTLGGHVRGNTIAIDRFALNAATSGELIEELAERIRAQVQHQPVRLIGFSAGGRWALALGARLGAQVRRIDLIAPLGPFSLGHYGSQLKGYPLFELARERPNGLRFILAFQALLARRAPKLLLRFLLQGSRGEDRALAQDPAFRALVLALFRHALGAGRSAYGRELVFATEDWSALLAGVAAPTHIWHGAQDNWAVPGMGEALARQLPAGAVMVLPGLSHYSALRKMLPILLAGASKLPGSQRPTSPTEISAGTRSERW